MKLGLAPQYSRRCLIPLLWIVAMASTVLSQVIVEPDPPGPIAEKEENEQTDPKKDDPTGGDPVVLATGNFQIRALDMKIAGRGMDFAFCRTYRSGTEIDSAIGKHWDFNWNKRIKLRLKHIYVAIYPGPVGEFGEPISGDGDGPGYLEAIVPDAAFYYDGETRIDRFKFTSDGWKTPTGYYSKLHSVGDGFSPPPAHVYTPPTHFELRNSDGTVFTFGARTQATGYLGWEYALTKLETRHGDEFRLEYSFTGVPANASHLERIYDTLGRKIELIRSTNELRVRDFTGREVVYTLDAYGNLTDVRSPLVLGTPNGNDFPDGKVTSYVYGDPTNSIARHNIEKIIDPNRVAGAPAGTQGTPFIQNVYSGTRVIRQLYGGEATVSGQTISAGGVNIFRYEEQSSNHGWFQESARSLSVDPNGNTRLTIFSNQGNDRVTLDFTGRLDPSAISDSTGISSLVSVNLGPTKDDVAGALLATAPGYVPPMRPSTDPSAYVTFRNYNSNGQVILEEGPGYRTVKVYNEDAIDAFQRGNILRTEDWPVPDDGTPPIVNVWIYEPLYNQVRATVSPRGNDATYMPSNGGVGGPDRYMTLDTFDYQEGDFLAVSALGDLISDWEIDVTQAEMFAKLGTYWTTIPVVPMNDASSYDLGDLNGDTVTDQTVGNVITSRSPTPMVFQDPLTPTPTFVPSSDVVVKYAYNEFSQLISVTDPLAQTVFYDYHTEQTPDGVTVTPDPPSGPLSGDPALGGGYLYQQRFPEPDPNGIIVGSAHDYLGRRTKHIDGRGKETQVTFNELDQTVQITSEHGYVTSLYYDFNDNLVRRELSNVVPTFGGDLHPAGESTDTPIATSLSYDMLDHVVEERTSADATTELVRRYRYDRKGNLVLELLPECANQPDNVVSRIYDERNLSWKVTRGGVAPEFRVLACNANITETVAIPDLPTASTTSVDYALIGLPSRTVDGESNETTMLYDGLGRVVIQQSPAAGNYGTVTYDPEDNVTEIQFHGDDGHGGQGLLSLTRSSFDELGRKFQSDEAIFPIANALPTADGPLTPGDSLVTTRFVWDLNSRLSQIINDNAQVNSRTYDALNRQTSRTDPEGNSVDFFYDRAGNLIRKDMTDIRASDGSLVLHSTWSFYDDQNRISAISDNTGHVARYAYDSRNNLRYVSDANGALLGTLADLDVHGDHAEIGGLPDLPINGNGNSTAYEYDLANRLILVEHHLRDTGDGSGAIDVSQAGDGIVRKVLRYDLNGRLHEEEDDNQNITRYEYDGLNRHSSTVFADQTSLTSLYDRNDQVIQGTDAMGSQFTYLYDSRRRMTQVDIVRAPGLGGVDHQTFTYDGSGRVVATFDNNDPTNPSDDHATLFYYDSLGRELVEGQDTFNVYRSFDGVGNQTAQLYPSGRLTRRYFDANSRLTSVKSGSFEIASYDYVGPSRLSARDLGSGAVQLRTQYDASLRVTQSRQTDTAGQLQAGTDYGYNRANKRVYESREHSGGTGNVWTYDSADRLTVEKSGVPDPAAEAASPGTGGAPRMARSYTLDGVNNFESVTVNGVSSTNQINEMNEYDSFKGIVQQHDDKGNRVASGSRTLVFDSFNRLLEVHENGVLLVRYTYYAESVRATKEFPDGSGIRYIYSDSDLVEERDLQTGAVLRQYVYGDAVNEPVQLRVFASGSTTDYYYLEDARGSILGLTDSSGVVVERVEYTAYGKPSFLDGAGQPLGSGASVTGNPLLFGASLYDTETGYYYLVHRYYDPVQGRFLSRDPVGLWGDDGGLGNGYSYCGNEPQNACDPRGTWATSEHKTWTSSFMWGKLGRGGQRYANIAANANGRTDTEKGSQDPANSYKHGMRSPGQNIATAKSMTEQFISKEIGQSASALLSGDRDMAADHLGTALHAEQDKTSPYHRDASDNPKEWHGTWHYKSVGHIREGWENTIKAKRAMDPANDRAWSKLNQEIGGAYSKILGDPLRSAGFDAADVEKAFEEAAQKMDAAKQLFKAGDEHDRKRTADAVFRKAEQSLLDDYRERAKTDPKAKETLRSYLGGDREHHGSASGTPRPEDPNVKGDTEHHGSASENNEKREQKRAERENKTKEGETPEPPKTDPGATKSKTDDGGTT
ncbi:MAG: RHS repeat protein [Planctomycetes bacterium]|nr:RHS repeat protein [Planctomycetota bacterium]